MKTEDIEARLRQVAWPAPSPELRARVLSPVPADSPAITWSDRVWFSRGWRIAAIAAALVLAALEQLSGPTQSAVLTPSARAVAEASMIDETARQAGLPPDEAAALARRALAAATQRSAYRHAEGSSLEPPDTGGEPR